MCQRLTRALAQVTQVTHQVIHYLHPTKKLNKFNTIKIKKIDTVFTNSKYSRTSDQHWLIFNLTDKKNLKSSDEYNALSNLSI